MERLKDISFLQFWSILALICLILVWFLPWRFQVNDDVIMMWLVSGAYTGQPESYAVFIHPILSWGLSQLYSVFPELPIYSLTWYFVIFLSYVAMIFSMDKCKIGYYWKNSLSVFYLILFLHFGLFLQFTIVAGIAGFSGLLLLEIGNRKGSKVLLIFSLVLITFSILIRWESFALILLAFGFYFLSFKPTGLIKEYLKLSLIPVLIMTALIGSKMVWEKQSEHADFVEYNKARAAVSDHPVTYKLMSQGKIDQKSRWFFFSQWMMEDHSITVEELEQRRSELDADLITIDQLTNSFSRLTSVLKTEAFKSIFSLILIILFLYRFNGSLNSMIFAGSWIFFFLLFNHFFILNGRVIILFFLPFLFPMVLESSFEKIGRGAFLIFTTALLLLFGYHLRNFFEEARGRAIMQEEFLLLTENLPKEALLIMEGYKENYLGISYTVGNQVPMLSMGWISKSQYQKEKLRKIGLNHISEANDFYLLGVDINNDFYFPDYMNNLKGDFRLESKTKLDNFVLFHYIHQ